MNEYLFGMCDCEYKMVSQKPQYHIFNSINSLLTKAKQDQFIQINNISY